MSRQYRIGLDYGTNTDRHLIESVATGKEIPVPILLAYYGQKT